MIGTVITIMNRGSRLEVRERKASIYQSEAMIGTVITNMNSR